MTEAKKPKVPRNADDKEQSKQFIELAKELGNDETDATLERAFKMAVPPKRKASKQR